MPYILIHEHDNARRMDLTDGETTFGRAADNTVVLTDSSVSSHHCLIRSEGGQYELEDLGSTNGTSVNEIRVVTKLKLNAGDMIHVGGVAVMFTSEDQNHASPFVGPSGTIRRAPVDKSPFVARKDRRKVWILVLAVIGLLVVVATAIFLRSLAIAGG